jgi:serine/threonine protein kinase
MSDMPEEEAGRLGRYTLVRRIGKGGMGEVWLAKASGAHGFEKNVALKRILPQFSSNAHVVNMLVDEARISVLLNHPNVVQVLELGEEHGDYFIAMEYVDGHALSRLLRRMRKAGHRLDPLEAASIVIQVLEGLHAAHIQKDHRGKPAGIIHRDVSPQNVLLSMDGLVKVIDFGIARARERLEVTQGTSVKGKLRYMAPEQLSPKLIRGKPIDHRVDVFAAGVVLFEALANRLRFPGDLEMEIMDAILKEDTPDLCKEGLVDRELMDILDTALEKDRDHRFKDAAAFAARLRSYLYKRDPGFTAERLARRMREAFGEDDAEPDRADRSEGERSAERESPSRLTRESQRAARLRSISGDEPLHREDEAGDVDATRTAFRPRVRASERAALAHETASTRSPQAGTRGGKRRARSRAPAVAAGLVPGASLLALGAFVGKPWLEARGSGGGPPAPSGPAALVEPGAPPAAAAPGDASAVGSPRASAPSAASAPAAPAAPSAPAAPPAPRPPPSRDGTIDVLVEAEPATTRISLADQPDPKYVSPAHIKLRSGEEVELVFEADGYEAQRRKLVVAADMPATRVTLRPLPVNLVLHVYPRDAVILVDGAPAKPGMKVIPGRIVEVRAEHPFATPRIVQGVPRPGEPYVVDIRLAEVEQASRGAPLPRGTLAITSRPPGAEVFVDGTRVRGTTPLETVLIAGSHRVTVRAASGEQTFAVDIAAGATVKRDVVLE